MPPELILDLIINQELIKTQIDPANDCRVHSLIDSQSAMITFDVDAARDKPTLHIGCNLRVSEITRPPHRPVP